MSNKEVRPSMVMGSEDALHKWLAENSCVYEDLEIYVCWYGILKEHFPYCLWEIAQKIRDEISESGSDEQIQRIIKFDDQEIIFSTHWSRDFDMVSVNADLAFNGEGHEYELVEEGDSVSAVIPLWGRTLH